MTSSRRSDSAPVNRQSAEVAVGLLVPPVLLGILVTRALADGLTQLGLVSEQLFAGDRLPNLKMPLGAPDIATPASES
ncbi:MULTISPECIES: hypothetical protein [unclassified Nodosilinea]|uniref:Uncharacterized protein n=2 Tax=Leptolyngbya TaxID=47251 RepID=A0ABV0K7Z9_9CYAN|nr:MULTISPECIES: hypothetical protein [unclassified Nodosilinea]MBD2114364.1 hypothetical protein [Nodosilinea sp. FACHB-141]